MSRKEEERTLLLTRLWVQIASKSAKSKIDDSIAWTIQLLWESLPTTKPSLSPFPWNLHLCMIKFNQVQLSLLTRNFNCSRNPLELGKKEREGRWSFSLDPKIIVFCHCPNAAVYTVRSKESHWIQFLKRLSVKGEMMSTKSLPGCA